VRVRVAGGAPDVSGGDAPDSSREGSLEGAGDPLPERARAGRRPPRHHAPRLRADAPRRRGSHAAPGRVARRRATIASPRRSGPSATTYRPAGDRGPARWPRPAPPAVAPLTVLTPPTARVEPPPVAATPRDRAHNRSSRAGRRKGAGAGLSWARARGRPSGGRDRGRRLVTSCAERPPDGASPTPARPSVSETPAPSEAAPVETRTTWPYGQPDVGSPATPAASPARRPPPRLRVSGA